MFNFRKTVLNPAINEITGKVDEAGKIQSVGKRIEGLLSLKEDADAKFSKIAAVEIEKSVGALFVFLPLVIALLASIAPLVVGIAIFGTVAYSFKKASDGTAANNAVEKLKNHIDTETSALATAYPQEAVKSPRFLNALKNRFNLASAGEPELNQLRAALAPAPVSAPSPTGPPQTGKTP